MKDDFDDIDLPSLSYADIQELVKRGHRLRNAAIRDAAERRSKAMRALVSALFRKFSAPTPGGKVLPSGGPHD